MTSALAGTRWGIHLNNYLAAASIAILYFDYCLTITSEIACFWGTKTQWSIGATLFVLNRYLGLLGVLPVMFEYFGDYTPELCRHLQSYHQYYAITMQLLVGSILILRTVALYNGSKRVLWGLFVVTAIVVVLTIVVTPDVLKISPSANDAQLTPEDLSHLGYCDLSLTAAQSLRLAVGWICMLTVETTIFGLTLFKSMRLRANLRRGLLRILFRDGAIYYGILVLAGATNLVTFLARGINGNARGVTTTLVNALSTTLASRMFLNLRDPNLHRAGMQVGRPTHSRLPYPGSTGIHSLSANHVTWTATLSFRDAVESETGWEIEMEDANASDPVCGRVAH